MLTRHDWTYAMSDDHSVWKRGEAAKKELLKITGESPEHQKLYDDYKAYAWNQGPQPQKPMEKAFRTGEAS